MKKVFLMTATAFIALAMSSQAFAVDMDYNSDTTTGTDNTYVNPDNTGTNMTTTPTMKKHHRRKKTSKTYNNRSPNNSSPNNGNLPSGGTTNGYDNGEPNDYNAPANE